MKKEVFKVFVLGLIGLTLFTGCNKNESVKKLKKNEEVINYEEQLNKNEDESYSIEYYKFKTKDTLLDEYNDVIYKLTEYDDYVSKVDVLANEDNLYEAIITQGGENLVNVYYEYVLLIKNDKEFISVFQTSKNEDKTFIKEIGKKIKNELSFNNNFREVFEDYAEENQLVITSEGFYKSSMDNCETALNASKSEVVIYTGSNRKVETVELDTIDLAAEKYKLVASAKNSDGQVIWSFDVGIIPKYSDVPFVNIKKGDKYVYYTITDTLEIRDIQTGKIIHSVKLDVEAPYLEMIEYKDKLFLVKGGHVDCDTLYVIDITNGKVLHKNNNFNASSITNLNNDNYSIGIDFENAKKEDDKIYLDVTILDKDTDKKITIGTATIDYNDYSVKYKKK